MINKINQFLINQNQDLRQAIKGLNQIEGGHHRQVLFVENDDKQIIGAITDGDIRRALINGKNLEEKVTQVMFSQFRFFRKGQRGIIETIKEFRKDEIFLLPVLNIENHLIDIIDLKQTRSLLPIEAVLMAGGEGKRLLPLTEKVPKPLLKVGEKPIISYNIDRLKSFGVKQFHLSLNYLGNQIETYVHNTYFKEVDLNFVYENEKLGTVGALTLIENFKEDVVLIMNSDLLTTIDFEAFYLNFIQQNADMSVATIPYNVKIPYAILEVKSSEVKALKEKPVFNYYSNAGIYLIKKSLLELIPKNTFFDATDLMEVVIAKNKKLVSFPIRHYWLDIGKPDDFERANEDIKYLKF